MAPCFFTNEIARVWRMRECGQFTGSKELFKLEECNSDIGNHLSRCHLSRELSYSVTTLQIRLVLILLLKTENAACCLLGCALLLQKYKQANKKKKQVTVGLKN